MIKVASEARRSFLIAIASLMLISTTVAQDIIVELSGARADHDPRTGKPVLKLRFSDKSQKALEIFNSNNLGQKIEFRVECPMS
jgi:hypothetical protein